MTDQHIVGRMCTHECACTSLSNMQTRANQLEREVDGFEMSECALVHVVDVCINPSVHAANIDSMGGFVEGLGIVSNRCTL